MSTITAPQVEKIKEYIDTTLPQAGMTGDIENTLLRFARLYAGIGQDQSLTEEQMADVLDFFTSREPKDYSGYWREHCRR
ncbi:MAG TPA: hypothetical protein VG075_04455 [Candidatus Acidoferrum sp.]|nr:hypothetical protein [Candidatus Acidoferrum sp.]